MNGQVRSEDTPQFLGAGVNVDQGLLGPGCANQGISLGGDLAEPGADRQHQVGRLGARHEFRVGGNAEISDEARMAVIEDVVAPKRAGDGKIVGLGEGEDSAALSSSTSSGRDSTAGPGRTETAA